MWEEKEYLDGEDRRDAEKETCLGMKENVNDENLCDPSTQGGAWRGSYIKGRREGTSVRTPTESRNIVSKRGMTFP